jgi:hypothetical protein
MSRRLADLKTDPKIDSSNDVDVLVKILRVFERDDFNLEMRIKDLSNEMWFIVIPRIKFGPLKVGDVIRIRAAGVNISSKRNVLQVR